MRDEGGQAAFEYMLVLPFFFLFLFLMVQVAGALEQWIMIEGASREGARCVAVRASAQDVTTRVENSSNGVLNGSNATITVLPNDPTTGTPGSDGSVQITGYQYTFGGTALSNFLNLVSGRSVTIPAIMMSAVTHMRIEEGSTPGICPHS